MSLPFIGELTTVDDPRIEHKVDKIGWELVYRRCGGGYPPDVHLIVTVTHRVLPGPDCA